MTYYIVDDTGMIVEQTSQMNYDIIQDLADYFDCPVYAIEGQHSGYTAEPQATKTVTS